jgi:phosphomannomutase
MNEHGMNQSNAQERAIERNFFREDFRRAFLNEIGLIEYAYSPIGSYREDFLRHVNVERIQRNNFRIVVDYSYGMAADTLADMLTELGVDVVPLNARIDETKLAMLQTEFKANQERVSKIVHALGADVGIHGTGNFIFPDFQPAVDGMLAAVRLLEYMAVRQLPISEVIAYLPPVYMAKASVVCGWDARGRVMRLLHNHYKDYRVENVDGLKIHLNDGAWVHLSPNPDKPQFEVLVEGTSQEHADALIVEYRQQIEQFVEDKVN